MLLSAHVSQVLLAMSLLSSPAALAKPIAPAPAPVGAGQETSLVVWERSYSGPTSLEARANGETLGRIQHNWHYVTAASTVLGGSWGIYSLAADCKEFDESKGNVLNGFKCVVAALGTAAVTGTVGIYGTAMVRATILYFNEPFLKRSDVLGIEAPEPAAPSLALEGPLIEI
ncbi:hypothetical protein CPLU01_15156 [Colletotrichum plurivorum]|uniref:Uncharacterized protein n=1 Tax=Colletotrichum plurivorum TaxID=2175906 RepID=A0A8H6MWV0_9PEZI|nr:hypothetical protein CPLU01_15156 [Colletotrichum plurivorum]